MSPLLVGLVTAELDRPENGEDAKTLSAAQDALRNCRQLLRQLAETHEYVAQPHDTKEVQATEKSNSVPKVDSSRQQENKDTKALIQRQESVVLKDKPWNLDPNAPRQQMWDLAMALLICMIAIFTPYEVSFLKPKVGGVLFTINRLVDLFFLMDMVMQFFLPFQSSGKDNRLIRSNYLIAKNYLLSWFFIDLVAIVPFDLITHFVPEVEKMRILRTVRLLRLAKLLRVVKSLRIFKRSVLPPSTTGVAVGVALCVAMACDCSLTSSKATVRT